MGLLNFHILTLFPEMINDTLSHSITGRAIKEEIIGINAVNIRDFTKNKHRHVDDYPYGGGAGMVMQPQPVYDAYKSIVDKEGDMRVVFMTPQGRRFDQSIAEELSEEKNIMLLCAVIWHTALSARHKLFDFGELFNIYRVVADKQDRLIVNINHIFAEHLFIPHVFDADKLFTDKY